jgi:hypothetical protein
MAVDTPRRPVEVLGLDAGDLALKRPIHHDLGSPCEAVAGRRFMPAILALVRLAHIGLMT